MDYTRYTVYLQGMSYYEKDIVSLEEKLFQYYETLTNQF